MDAEHRVLLFTPTGRDAEMVGEVLRNARIDSVAGDSWMALEPLLNEGAAALIISEEALQPTVVMRLRMLLSVQPPWSDLPVLLLTGRNADSPGVLQASLGMGNVTLLERPMRIVGLVSAVRGALRARARQYENRAQLLALERAAAALSASERQLRDAHARKDEFLATLAHELRNPLAPIRNALYVLRRKSPEPALAPLHDIVDRQVRQMVRLVDDLLEVSRFTRGKINLQIEDVDIASVVRSAIETSRPLIDAARHELIVQLSADALFVRADALRLGQVFANLLNNAAKYTENGGTLTVSVHAQGDEVVATISDTGVGIPPDMLHSIFDMFTQVREQTNRAQGGLGIGLTLAKTLVDLHHGRVEAHSDGRGKGSRFSVYLPRMEHGASAAAAPRIAEARAALPHTILVDDNRDAADTLAMVLRAHGAQVQTLYEAADVLNVLAPQSKSVVIADLSMPGMDGYELARRIRDNRAHGQVRLIALSGRATSEDRARAEAAGFDAHFTKPPDIDSLMTLLASFR